MGIFHVYCTICHGPTILDADPFEDPDAEHYDEEDYASLIPRLDPELVTRQSIGWVTEMRMVGLNPKSRFGDHCFISDEGTCDDTGTFFEWDPIDDPFSPDEDELGCVPGCVPEFRVCPRRTGSRWPEDGNFFVFHSACYKVLEAMASRRLARRYDNRDYVDSTMLFSLLRYVYSPEHNYPDLSSTQNLTLPYIDVHVEYDEGPGQQFWEFRRGEEVYASNPFEIPQLEIYYENLPLLPERNQTVPLRTKRRSDESPGNDSLQPSRQTQVSAKRQKSDQKNQDPKRSSSYNNESRDPLGRLPPEILLDVFIHLPAPSIVNMKIASLAARHIQLSNWFWWNRVQSAMPCLWDLPSFHGPTGSENIDWRQVYKDLSTQGRGHGHEKILGLVNRHRIWQKWEWKLRAWFEEQADRAIDDVRDAIWEWGDRQSFREWRTGRGQTMSGDSLPSEGD